MLVAVYQFFAVVPTVIAARLFRSRFTRRLNSLFAFMLHTTAFASWAVFLSYVFKFLVLYRPSLLPADLLALIRTALEQLP